MLRLTVTSQTSREIVLKVEGWITGGQVALLEEEGTRRLQQAERLVLDLNGVRFIDRAGIALLKRWAGEWLVLRNGSSFIQTLLKTNGLDMEWKEDAVGRSG